MTDNEGGVADTEYGKCGWPSIIKGVVFAHPVSDFGMPYVNQLLPIRRATVLERLAFAMFGTPPKLHRPTPSKEQ